MPGFINIDLASDPPNASRYQPRSDASAEARVYYVYILASRRYGTLYIGVTNNVGARLELHRMGLGSEFVKKYKVHRLVYVEPYENAEDAIRREKQLKKWNREWKVQLIEQDNPEWRDRTSLLA